MIARQSSARSNAWHAVAAFRFQRHRPVDIPRGLIATTPSQIDQEHAVALGTAQGQGRFAIKEDCLVVQLADPPPYDMSESANLLDVEAHDSAKTLIVPWKKSPSKQPRQIIPPASPSTRQDNRPIRAETRAKLISAIAKARLWLDELVSGVAGLEEIAEREKCSVRQVNRTVTLAFLAPRLVEAAVQGRLPRGIGVARLRDLPVEWSGQHQRLGLSS